MGNVRLVLSTRAGTQQLGYASLLHIIIRANLVFSLMLQPKSAKQQFAQQDIISIKEIVNVKDVLMDHIIIRPSENAICAQMALYLIHRQNFVNRLVVVLISITVPKTQSAYLFPVVNLLINTIQLQMRAALITQIVGISIF